MGKQRREWEALVVLKAFLEVVLVVRDYSSSQIKTSEEGEDCSTEHSAAGSMESSVAAAAVVEMGAARRWKRWWDYVLVDTC